MERIPCYLMGFFQVVNLKSTLLFKFKYMNKREIIMKNFTLLILFLSGFLFNGLAAPGWRMLNPYPQANQLNDVFVFNDSTAIAVGESQVVIKTTNGGVNWDVISNAGGGFHELKALDFISTEI